MATERFIVVTQNDVSVENGIFYSRESANSFAKELVAEYGFDHQVFEIRLSDGENFKHIQVVEVEEEEEEEEEEESEERKNNAE